MTNDSSVFPRRSASSFQKMECWYSKSLQILRRGGRAREGPQTDRRDNLTEGDGFWQGSPDRFVVKHSNGNSRMTRSSGST